MLVYKIALRPKDDYDSRLYFIVRAWNQKAARTIVRAFAPALNSDYVIMYVHKLNESKDNNTNQGIIEISEK